MDGRHTLENIPSSVYRNHSWKRKAEKVFIMGPTAGSDSVLSPDVTPLQTLNRAESEKCFVEVLVFFLT